MISSSFRVFCFVALNFFSFANNVFLFFFSLIHCFYEILYLVLTYDRTEEDDSSLPNLDGSYASRSSVLPPGILPHGMPQVKGISHNTLRSIKSN